MEESNLDDQLKAAERDKYLAEARKVESEKQKVDLEHQQLIKEINKPWWFSTKFKQQFVSVLIGISFLGFYINFVIIPLSTIDNLQLKLDNKVEAFKLFESETKLKDHSLKFISFSDSVSTKLKNDSLRYIFFSDSMTLKIQKQYADYINYRNVVAKEKEKNEKELADLNDLANFKILKETKRIDSLNLIMQETEKQIEEYKLRQKEVLESFDSAQSYYDNVTFRLDSFKILMNYYQKYLDEHMLKKKGNKR